MDTMFYSRVGEAGFTPADFFFFFLFRDRFFFFDHVIHSVLPPEIMFSKWYLHKIVTYHPRWWSTF